MVVRFLVEMNGGRGRKHGGIGGGRAEETFTYYTLFQAGDPTS